MFPTERIISNNQEHLDKLFAAELQFRLASAVRLAVTFKNQPLDLPSEWTHGKHRVKYEEIALRQDQADAAACLLHRSATYLIAVAIRDALRGTIDDPKNSSDSDIRGAYQIARLIRNAFAHDPFSPKWAIDADCRGHVFAVSDLISLDTTDLDGTDFDWRHYGGPLALFRLGRYVRRKIFHEEPKPRKDLPPMSKNLVQQGNLVLHQIDRLLPRDARPIAIQPLPDGGIPLGNGHILYPGKMPDDGLE
jgi:hypothetical protein